MSAPSLCKVGGVLHRQGMEVSSFQPDDQSSKTLPAGAGGLGLHSLAVANSATVLSGTALTVPSGLPGDAQLAPQWPHMGADGPGGLAVLPPTLTRPRGALEAVDTVPVSCSPAPLWPLLLLASICMLYIASTLAGSVRHAPYFQKRQSDILTVCKGRMLHQERAAIVPCSPRVGKARWNGS